MATKYKYRTKKKKPNLSKEVDYIYKAIHELEESEHKLKDFRNFNKKLKDLFNSKKIKVNKWLKLNWKQKIKHILIKVLIMYLCWLIVQLGFYIPKEIMMLIDIILT